MKSIYLFMLTVSVFLLSFVASAAQSHSPVPSPVPTSAPSAKGKTIWDSWYTIKVGKGIHYAYYNDRLEQRGNQLFFQNKIWKNEEGFTNEEQVGGLCADDAELTPLFFNFHSSYRASETVIDGNVKVGPVHILTVKARKGGKDLPVIQHSIPKNVILSIFFPAWLKKHLPQMKEGHDQSFLTILEDNIELGFASVAGRARVEKPDAFAMKTKTRKVFVNIRDLSNLWYVDSMGDPVRIEMPAQKMLIEKVSKSEAEKFLAPAGD